MISPVKHGGNVHAIARNQGRSINRIIDFSASINPLGLSPSVRRAVQQAIPHAVHYPDVDAQPLRSQLARLHRIPDECLVLGNGSAELISVLPKALGSRHGLVIGPTFMEFERALTLAGADCTYVHAESYNNYQPPIERACTMLKGEKGQRGKKRIAKKPPIDTVLLCNPNSPTGQPVSRKHVHLLLESVRKVKGRLIVDEAFIDYCGSYSVFREVGQTPELIVLRSFTKFYAMPGLRLGYLGGPEDIVKRVRTILPPWTVNALASAAGTKAIQDTAYQRRSLVFMNQERKRFRAALRKVLGLRVYPSSANFFLTQLETDSQVEKIVQSLHKQGILIRNCRDFAGILNPTIRLAVRRPRENDRLVKALKRELVKCR